MASSGKFVVLLLTISLMMRSFDCETRYFVKMLTNTTDPLGKLIGNYPSGIIDDRQKKGNDTKIDRVVNHPDKSRSSFRIDDETMIRESLKDNLERRNSFIESSTFDPDVLNKFLDDYANKIKSTTEKNFNFPFRIGKPDVEKFQGDKADDRPVMSSLGNEKNIEINKTTVNLMNSTIEVAELNQQDLNDTIKRNKYFGAQVNDDRNGWVTLEAIPWSKSKISKWQASSSSQRPWPDMKAWEKPNGGKPWPSEHPSRPAYINNEPWPEISKPPRPDYQSARPSTRPQTTARPSYFADRFDPNSNQAQKWPPERPQSSWDKFPSMDSYKPNIEIITDNRPSNFPTSWDKYAHATNDANKNQHSYNNRDVYTSNYDDNNNNHHHNEQTNHDWRDNINNYPSKFEHYKDRPSNFGRPTNDHQSPHDNRPQHLSHYQYTPDHLPSHPSSGDGQWVLLSTNGGYSKSRQRSIKLDDVQRDNGMIKINSTTPTRTTKQDNDGSIAIMTSKRQVRLTVLPSINGTNTTTSHGGLLEVEKTFKTVEQSRQEYEDGKITSVKPFIVNNRPIRNTIIGRPSNSAILAAVGAGMVPATMAMMIPMMLGRKKRSPKITTIHYDDVAGNWNYDTKLSMTREEFARKLRN